MATIEHSMVDVEITQRRWNVEILVRDSDGDTYRYIASADSSLTEGSAIWFGDEDEYEEAMENV